MPNQKDDELFEELLARHFRPHHLVKLGNATPEWFECIVEMPAESPVKIEICKESGLARIDRPQPYSTRNPFPYGLFPQTHCGKRVAELCMQRTGRKKLIGDGDPLDVCILTSTDMPMGIGLQEPVRVIGGLPMIDRGEADDKIIAVRKDDLVFSDLKDISQMPPALLRKLIHYFVNYKRPPEDTTGKVVKIKGTYGRDHALQVIAASQADYVEKYGTPAQRLHTLKQLLLADLLQDKEALSSMLTAMLQPETIAAAVGNGAQGHQDGRFLAQGVDQKGFRLQPEEAQAMT